MKDETSPLSTAALLTEIHDAMEHVASASAMGAAQMTRAVRILDAGHQLSTRDRVALERATDRAERVATRLEGVADKLSPRPKSLTVVTDVKEEKSGRHGDITGVFVLGRRLPSRWLKAIIGVLVALLIAAVTFGVVLGHHGVTPGQVVRTAAPLVAP